jgi:hypothetical protein
MQDGVVEDRPQPAGPAGIIGHRPSPSRTGLGP